jgi:transcriptional regulator with XRE-family HTH domain
MEIFARNLKKERLFNQLTQKQFAEKLGISVERYKKYECVGKGKRTPDLEMLVRIAAVLNTTTDELLGKK